MADLKRCGECAACGCEGCGVCGRQITLTAREVALLRELGVLAFLPYAAKSGNEDPLYRSAQAGEFSRELISLRCKRLISLDDDQPLDGFDYAGYGDRPVRGSMALTQTGQEAVDALDRQVFPPDGQEE